MAWWSNLGRLHEVQKNRYHPTKRCTLLIHLTIYIYIPYIILYHLIAWYIRILCFHIHTTISPRSKPQNTTHTRPTPCRRGVAQSPASWNQLAAAVADPPPPCGCACHSPGLPQCHSCIPYLQLELIPYIPEFVANFSSNFSSNLYLYYRLYGGSASVCNLEGEWAAWCEHTMVPVRMQYQ